MVVGREAIIAFLERKWAKELDYRLHKELWGFRGNRMAVSFEYEWHDEKSQWYRSYGVELWEFNEDGLMRRRLASINDAPIAETARRVRFDGAGTKRSLARSSGRSGIHGASSAAAAHTESN